MTSITGSAPGRLDLLGGVADYSGALVLEVPTRRTTTVVAEPADALSVGPVQLSAEEIAAMSQLPYSAMRDALAPRPRWTHYVVGVALVLVRHGVIEPPKVRLSVSSEVPQSVGVSSSAALEVATRACARRRRYRAAPAGLTLPGGGEPGRRCTVRDHGPGRRRHGAYRRGASHLVPTRLGTSPGSAARRDRGRGPAHRRRARRQRCALPPCPRRRVHGQADHRGRCRGRSGRG